MERLKWRSFSISSRSYWTAILLPKMKGALDLWKRHGNDCVRASYDEIPKVTQDEVFAGARAFVKREFYNLIGFLIVALIAVGLVFNAGGVKDVLLELFNKIIGA